MLLPREIMGVDVEYPYSATRRSHEAEVLSRRIARLAALTLNSVYTTRQAHHHQPFAGCPDATLAWRRWRHDILASGVHAVILKLIMILAI